MEIPALRASYSPTGVSFLDHDFPYSFVPENYVHWTQNPESHLFSADLPGVRREEIRVEVEDSRYLIIRTAAIAAEQPCRSFNRKFRLPERVDVDGISAEFVTGILTVTVPRSFVRRGFYIDPADVAQGVNFLARAA